MESKLGPTCSTANNGAFMTDLLAGVTSLQPLYARYAVYPSAHARDFRNYAVLARPRPRRWPQVMIFVFPRLHFVVLHRHPTAAPPFVASPWWQYTKRARSGRRRRHRYEHYYSPYIHYINGGFEGEWGRWEWSYNHLLDYFFSIYHMYM